MQKKTNRKLEDMKVLIADDQQEARSMIKNMVKTLGINQIFEANDGKQALQFFDTMPEYVDVIICDWNMPSISGVEFLRQLRSVNANIPFLMVTGRSDAASVLEAKSSGVTSYIRKPFSSQQLEAKLRIIMNSDQYQKQS